MRDVRLITSSGEFVCSGTVPPFDEAPDVLFWGTRVFVYEVTDDDDVDVYKEAFCCALIQTD